MNASKKVSKNRFSDNVVKTTGICLLYRKICLISEICIFLLLISGSAIAQAPDTLWMKIFGKNLQDSRAYSVKQTNDEGFIITGYTDAYGAGGHDVWLIRTDSEGDTLWTKTYGGTLWDEGRCVQQTDDDGYIIAGYTKSFGNGGGSADVWLIKTSATGDTLWTKTYGIFSNDYAYSVQQTIDGGYILCGETNNIGTGSNVYLIKTNAEGDSIWSKSYGGITHEAGYSVQQTDDDGYIITGVALEGISNLNRNVWLIKTNPNGDTLWTKVIGTYMHDDWSHCVQQTEDGGYVIVGETTSFGAGGYDIWLIKTNPAGDTLWTKTFGGSTDDYGYSVQQTSDEGYIVTGYTESFGAGNFDLWLLKTDSSGDTLWTKTLGGIQADYGYSVQQTMDGGYIVTGVTLSYGLGANKIWLIGIASGTTAIEENTEADFEVYPNPTNGKFYVSSTGFHVDINKVELVDMFGKVVKSFSGNFNAENMEFDVSDLSAGVYFLHILSGNQSATEKFIIQN